ncbi:MAG: leucyl/phenylalanyl-tRNA--protein transferase [Nitrospirota bacterium]|nr:leucyl/phenylalanyl-tRNA--protein transferase [Nitrospirota bacterium]
MPVFRITNDLVFPHPGLAEEDGLLAVGGDLSTERLLLAYRNGIFPWYSKGDPILWWSPDPRCVLLPEKLKVSTRLRRTLNRKDLTVTFDRSFNEVINHCATVKRTGQRGTWITQEMIAAYKKLNQEGYAHSVEVLLDGELAGGLYGVSVGKVFCGESMFSLRPDASKIALVHLAARLREWKFPIIDCQVTNPYLLSMGAEEISRASFLEQVRKLGGQKGHVGPWE